MFKILRLFLLFFFFFSFRLYLTTKINRKKKRNFKQKKKNDIVKHFKTSSTWPQLTLIWKQIELQTKAQS